jgi:hypothetical protein
MLLNQSQRRFVVLTNQRTSCHDLLPFMPCSVDKKGGTEDANLCFNKIWHHLLSLLLADKPGTGGLLYS